MARAIDAEKTKMCIQNIVEHLLESGNTEIAGSLTEIAGSLQFAIEIIDAQPTIDPVKHGKWIEKTWHSRGGYRYLKCECGKEHCIEKPIDDIVDICSECGKINEASFRNYCPNCGARMDGE